MRENSYQKFRGAMAYIEVRDHHGDIGIGSAFHIGSGVYVTARHVVDKNTILHISTTESYNVPDDKGNITIHGKERRFKNIDAKVLTIKSGPFYHPDENVDVAILVVEENDNVFVELGGHLNDWIDDAQFLLWPVIIMGYPKIPFSRGPILFVSTAEINAVVDKYNGFHPHFIVSSMARAGFSGGLCLIDENVLGVIVESLVFDKNPTELGYLSVLTVEPIYDCLLKHKIVPKEQENMINLLHIGDSGNIISYDEDDKPF